MTTKKCKTSLCQLVISIQRNWRLLEVLFSSATFQPGRRDARKAIYPSDYESNDLLALSNTRFKNGGNGWMVVECVLLERICEKKSVGNNNIKSLLKYKGILNVCFFLLFSVPLELSGHQRNSCLGIVKYYFTAVQCPVCSLSYININQGTQSWNPNKTEKSLTWIKAIFNDTITNSRIALIVF